MMATLTKLQCIFSHNDSMFHLALHKFKPRKIQRLTSSKIESLRSLLEEGHLDFIKYN